MLASFASLRVYPLAVALALLLAGFFDPSFSRMAEALVQALVQLNAPADLRGRLIGLFNMASRRMWTFAGINVGLAGSLMGIHASLAGVGAVVLRRADRSVASLARVARARRSIGQRALRVASTCLTSAPRTSKPTLSIICRFASSSSSRWRPGHNDHATVAPDPAARPSTRHATARP